MARLDNNNLAFCKGIFKIIPGFRVFDGVTITIVRATEVMRSLISGVKAALSLDLSSAEVCFDECRNCSIKLIEYIAMQLDGWEDPWTVVTFPIFVILTGSPGAPKKFATHCKRMEW